LKQVTVPARTDLQNAYEYLQFKDKSVTTDDLVKWSHWARLDARLAELIVRFIAKRFEAIAPLKLWRVNRASPQPQALAVLIEFAELLLRKHKSNIFTEFLIWKKAVLSHLSKASFQMFFVPAGLPDPERLAREIDQQIKPYEKWGFFARDWIALDKPKSNISCLVDNRTILSAPARRSALAKLLEQKEEITVADYIAACESRVHRRMAERDLQSSSLVRARGQTRARVYRKIDRLKAC
jgi:hypothetical protein